MSFQDVDAEVLSALEDAVYSRNGWWRAHCPFCLLNTGKDDKRRSLGVHEEGGYHCFRCCEKGHLSEVPEWIGESDKRAEPVTEVVSFEPPEGYMPLWEGAGRTARVLKPARQYLRDRGFGAEIWQAAQIGACLDGPYRGRVVVPIFDDARKSWVGFVARLWRRAKHTELPYRYPPGMQRGTIMFEHAVLARETAKPVLVVEGVLDALWYLGRVVACLGKPSKWQVEELKRARRPVAVCLDGDAWQEAYALAMVLRLEGVRAGFVRLPAKKDPNTVDPQWLLREADACVA